MSRGSASQPDTKLGSAAFGVVAVLLLAAVSRCLTWECFRLAVRGALRISGMVFLIIVGSSTFSQILAYTGASTGLIEWATEAQFTPIGILLILFGILLVLGMLMDQTSILMLTIPIYIPLAEALNFDLVWLGVLMLLGLEISLTTPPFGMLLFIMLGVAPAGTTMRQVILAAAPYIGCDLIVVVLLILFPQIALYLPGLME